MVARFGDTSVDSIQEIWSSVGIYIIAPIGVFFTTILTWGGHITRNENALKHAREHPSSVGGIILAIYERTFLKPTSPLYMDMPSFKTSAEGNYNITESVEGRFIDLYINTNINRKTKKNINRFINIDSQITTVFASMLAPLIALVVITLITARIDSYLVGRLR